MGRFFVLLICGVEDAAAAVPDGIPLDRFDLAADRLVQRGEIYRMPLGPWPIDPSILDGPFEDGGDRRRSRAKAEIAVVADGRSRIIVGAFFDKRLMEDDVDRRPEVVVTFGRGRKRWGATEQFHEVPSDILRLDEPILSRLPLR